MEEEAAAMEKFRASASTSNPFAAAPPAGAEEAPNILDLFGVAAPPAGAAAAAAPPPAAAAAPPQAAAASDDLLQLSGNPFANMLNGKIMHPVRLMHHASIYVFWNKAHLAHLE